MVMKVDEMISIVWYFDANRRKTVLLKVVWKSKTYKISKIGLHHTFKKGEDLIHVFSVVADDLFFRLEFNSVNLQWRLKEVSNGLPE